MTAPLELYAAVCTSALSDKFYESSDERLERILRLLPQVKPHFAMKLAVYAREQMHLRTIPVVLAVEIAKLCNEQDYGIYERQMVGKTVNRIVQRADEITELLSYYQTANDRTGTKKLNKLSKQVQKGLSQAFNKFNEYQFAKYDRGTAVKLRDALFLVHPKPKNAEQQIIFNKIADKDLDTPETWEVGLSGAGQGLDNDEEKMEAKKEVWEALVAEEQLGYMAMMRNLRNMLQAGVSRKTIDKVCEFLADPEQVAKSKQFPFRFLAAHREIANISSVDTAPLMEALEKAMDASAANIQGFDRDTSVFISTDFSGSMGSMLSEKSSIHMWEVALVLAMLMRDRCKSVITSVFGTTHQVLNLSNRSGILSNCAKLSVDQRNDIVGSSTNGHLVIQHLLDEKIVMDKVMLFSDMQLWNSGYDSRSFASKWHDYKRFNPKAKLYLFDLQGYGDTPLSTAEQDVYLIAGWSEKIFGILAALERGSNAVAEIEAIEL